MVTVMVTSYDITEKDIEGSKRIILYNIYNIYVMIDASWRQHGHG